MFLKNYIPNITILFALIPFVNNEYTYIILEGQKELKHIGLCDVLGENTTVHDW